MHPILARKAWLGSYVAAWLPVGGLLAVLLALPGELTVAEASAIALPLALTCAFECLASWYLCRALPVPETAPARLVATYGPAALVSSGLWTVIGHGIAWAVAFGAGRPAIVEAYRRQVPILLIVGILLFLLAVAVHYLLAAFEASRLAERRALELQVLAGQAELRALRAQVDPHFLFNSLHSISALTTADPAGARRMCLLLGEFLRNSLRLGARDLITLDEELSLVDQFLSIEKVRFGARLTIERDIEPETGRCLLPPLLLQPLVENAVRHGIAGLTEGGTIAIDSRRLGERLRITVENPCDPDRRAREGASLGLANVKLRVERRFGRDARLDAVERDGRFRVDVIVPAIEGESGVAERAERHAG
jgi:hypothetical protein